MKFQLYKATRDENVASLLNTSVLCGPTLQKCIFLALPRVSSLWKNPLQFSKSKYLEINPVLFLWNRYNSYYLFTMRSSSTTIRSCRIAVISSVLNSRLQMARQASARIAASLSYLRHQMRVSCTLSVCFATMPIARKWICYFNQQILTNVKYLSCTEIKS